jgi:hypothetical protein
VSSCFPLQGRVEDPPIRITLRETMCPFGKEQVVTRELCIEDKYFTHTTGIQKLYLGDK